MTDDPRIQQLLDEHLDSHATPEEVCATCSELLPVVRERWRQMGRVRADLDALFPPKDVPSTKVYDHVPPSDELTPQSPEGIALPRIPGYEVEGVLGQGGMGVVYQARHLRLNRPVALKMLLGGAFASPRERERFQREAEAVAGLRHPNIVQVYDVGDVDGRPYFTMELVEGGSLDQKLAGTPCPARQAAALVAVVAEAIQAAHQCGIVHRDLKPANVLLTAEGTPKVTDFGLARRLEGGGGLTQTGAAMGTPSYMAPEQARGDKGALGPATDVYALGAILYECLTGRPPFRAETATATLRQVVEEEPVPPARLNPRVPRDLETICLKCLQKGPSQRYASAAALADDLRRFERGEPITARPPGPLERAAKWVRRRPTVAALLGAGLLMLAGITAAAVWYVGDRARLRAEAQSRGREVNREPTPLCTTPRCTSMISATGSTTRRGCGSSSARSTSGRPPWSKPGMTGSEPSRRMSATRRWWRRRPGTASGRWRRRWRASKPLMSWSRSWTTSRSRRSRHLTQGSLNNEGLWRSTSASLHGTALTSASRTRFGSRRRSSRRPSGTRSSPPSTTGRRSPTRSRTCKGWPRSLSWRGRQTRTPGATDSGTPPSGLIPRRSPG
jgi:serine/threonine-protein kinase